MYQPTWEHCIRYASGVACCSAVVLTVLHVYVCVSCQALAVTVWTMGLYGLHVLRILVRQGGNAAVKTVKAATKKQK